MATPTTSLPRFARDLLRNPAPCAVSIHAEPSAATRVLEAQVPAYISDFPLHWLLCDADECEEEARKQADSYLPTATDLRDVTVLELESISGLDVLGALDEQDNPVATAVEMLRVAVELERITGRLAVIQAGEDALYARLAVDQSAGRAS